MLRGAVLLSSPQILGHRTHKPFVAAMLERCAITKKSCVNLCDRWCRCKVKLVRLSIVLAFSTRWLNQTPTGTIRKSVISRSSTGKQIKSKSIPAQQRIFNRIVSYCVYLIKSTDLSFRRLYRMWTNNGTRTKIYIPNHSLHATRHSATHRQHIVYDAINLCNANKFARTISLPQQCATRIIKMPHRICNSV